MSFLNCFLVNPFLDYVSEKLIKAMYSLCQSTIYSYNSFQPLLGLIDNMPYPHCPVGPSYEDCPVGQPPPSSSPSQLEAHGGK